MLIIWWWRYYYYTTWLARKSGGGGDDVIIISTTAHFTCHFSVKFFFRSKGENVQTLYYIVQHFQAAVADCDHGNNNNHWITESLLCYFSPEMWKKIIRCGVRYYVLVAWCLTTWLACCSANLLICRHAVKNALIFLSVYLSVSEWLTVWVIQTWWSLHSDK